MAKKYKVTKGMNYDKIAEMSKCVACNGSGYYDSWDSRKNKSIPCGSCDGTGKNT